MAKDMKYGQVTLERGHIGDDEPVVVFRARDKILHELLFKYYQLCLKAGSPQFHLDLIEQRAAEIANWQHAHASEVRSPASEGYQRYMEKPEGTEL